MLMRMHPLGAVVHEPERGWRVMPQHVHSRQRHKTKKKVHK